MSLLSTRVTEIVPEGSAEVDAKHIHKKPSQRFPPFLESGSSCRGFPNKKSSSVVIFSFLVLCVCFTCVASVAPLLPSV